MWYMCPTRATSSAQRLARRFAEKTIITTMSGTGAAQSQFPRVRPQGWITPTEKGSSEMKQECILRPGDSNL
jgi:hypothetical protein